MNEISQNNDRLEEYFIQQQLYEWGNEMTFHFNTWIKRKKLIDSKELINSVHLNKFGANVRKQSISFSFSDHGRFQDMGAGAGSGKIENVDTNSIVWGMAKSKKRRYPKKWYTKTVFRYLSELYDGLQYGYTDAIKKKLITRFK
jgi:hypothetical protein